MRRSKSYPGVTLIELVLVMGILGVLMGLTLSAVQKARESVNRASCANNLRQIGLGLSQYHNAFGSLPPGLSWDPPTWTMSWEVFIAPYLEQASLAQQVRDAIPQFHGGMYSAIVVPTVIPVYGCPSDSFAKSPHDYFHPGLVTYTSYLGVEGTSMYRHDGCLFERSKIRWADIGDGASNTLLVGERPSADDFSSCHSIWYTGLWSQWPGSGSCSSVLGVREVMVHPIRGCKRAPAHFRLGQLYNECDFFHFWSLHGGGANFLLADGSVHFLSYAGDNILPALATRNGGEVVDY